MANQAELAIASSDYAIAIDRLLAIADAVFAIEAFAPDSPLVNWQEVLEQWVRGLPLADVDGDRVEVAQFIESDLIYRLVWGMEAARVYEQAQGNADATSLTGAAAAAIETGTFSRPASILIRSGFDHRLAAIAAVATTGATFESVAEMRGWIGGLDLAIALDEGWPTPESRRAWEAFAYRARTEISRQWKLRRVDVEVVNWFDEVPAARAWLRITNAGAGKIEVWSPGFDLLGEASFNLNPDLQGVLRARRLEEGAGIELQYRGPDNLSRPLRRSR